VPLAPVLPLSRHCDGRRRRRRHEVAETVDDFHFNRPVVVVFLFLVLGQRPVMPKAWLLRCRPCQK
jgi:hypothetical protein